MAQEQQYDARHEPYQEDKVDASAGSHWQPSGQTSGFVDPHSTFDPTSFTYTGTAYQLGMDAALSFGHDAALHPDYYSDYNDLMLTQPGPVDPLANAYPLWSSWDDLYSTVRDSPLAWRVLLDNCKRQHLT